MGKRARKDPIVSFVNRSTCLLLNVQATKLLSQDGERFVVILKRGDSIILKPLASNSEMVDVVHLNTYPPGYGMTRLGVGALHSKKRGKYKCKWDDVVGGLVIEGKVLDVEAA